MYDKQSKNLAAQCQKTYQLLRRAYNSYSARMKSASRHNCNLAYLTSPKLKKTRRNKTGKLILNNVVVVENLNAQLAKLSYQTRYSPA